MNMKNDFDRILDECINRVGRGERLDSCLADYPDFTEQLRPLLQAVLTTREACSFVPSTGRKRAARGRFDAALEKLRQTREERQPRFVGFLGWSRIWATVATVILIAVIGFFAMKPVLFPVGTMPPTSPGVGAPGTEPATTPPIPGTQPGTPPAVVVAEPTPEGNFAFLISDEVNAISDFKSVNVSISKISLLRSGDAGQAIEFKPELSEVDLTLLQGEATQEIWRGNIPEGEYTGISIEVSNVLGILKETGQEVEIKLPGQKLHISKSFQVSADADVLTTFTYDITVIATGGPKNAKYILKPQVDQSGAGYQPIESRERVKKEKPNSN